MQAAMKIGWVGQTYALPRCSSSPGKKTRNRRSKKERKTMVESFVKKYQGLNNGSFPSLNLTHKEVGGSFYTIREIVREIIQENKVLGPGNPNSQGVALDDCVESSSIESGSHFSLATNGNLIEEVEKEAIFISSHHQLHDEGVVVAEGDPGSNICIKSHDHKNLQIVDCDFLDMTKIVTKSAQKGRYKPQGDNQVNVTDQSDDEGDSKIHKLENPVRDYQGNFGRSVSETMLQTNSESNENIGNTVLDNTGHAISKSTEIDSSENLASAYGDILAVSDGMENYSSSQPKESFELSSISTLKVCPEQNSLAKEDCVDSLGALETSNLSEVKKADASDNHSEVSNINRVPSSQHSIEEEISMTGNIRPRISGDKFAKKCATVLDTSDCPSSDSAKIEVEPLLMASNIRTEKASITSETVTDLSPCHETTSKIEVRNEIRHSSTGSKLGSSSLSDEVSSELSEDAYEHQELQETNPVMSAVRGFFAAIIRFFRE